MPPLPSNAMMRYRPNNSLPGRNLPSFIKYSAEVEGRDEDPDGGRIGEGEVGAKSRVATSSVLETGLPQAEQKRMSFASAVPQVEHLAMNFSRYSLTQASDVGCQAAND